MGEYAFMLVINVGTIPTYVVNKVQFLAQSNSFTPYCMLCSIRNFDSYCFAIYVFVFYSKCNVSY